VDFNDSASGDLENELVDQILGEVHQVVVVSVGHVGLDRSELWVVSLIDAFVSELLSDFVNPVVASNDEHFEVELGGDSHEEVHSQIVVEGLEGLGSGAAGDHVHHGGLDLQEVELVEVVSDEADDFAPLDEDVPGLGVHDEVQIPLPVPGLLRLEAEVLGGQHVQARGEELDHARSDAELVGLGSERASLDPDDVAPPEHLVELFERDLVGVGLSAGHD
jgi:hypothetical protein